MAGHLGLELELALRRVERGGRCDSWDTVMVEIGDEMSV
jgi:hypothetical protein